MKLYKNEKTVIRANLDILWKFKILEIHKNFTICVTRITHDINITSVRENKTASKGRTVYLSICVIHTRYCTSQFNLSQH